MTYESTVTVFSQCAPDVSYSIYRMSFGRRLELMRQVRETAARLDFLRAGANEADQMEARILAAEIEQLYVRWGVREVCGLEIDGEPATPETLASSGPEDLFAEAVQAVARECGLDEEERKN
jgi:hypothetical protein